MSPIGDILERFRRITAPGPAIPGEGVPEDEDAARVSELTGLLPQLAAIEAEAAATERAAGEEAQRIVAAARSRAEHILAEAGGRAATSRARAETDVHAAVDAEIQLAATESEAQARDILENGRRRMPGVVEAVLDCVRRTGERST